MLYTRLWASVFFSLFITSTASAWSPPVDISEIGLNSHQSQIAVDTDGNATAVWTETIEGGTVIQASTKLFGDSWQTPVPSLN